MQALEIPVEIDKNHQIYVQLPATIKAKVAKVIVMYEDNTEPTQMTTSPIKLGLFKGLIDTPDDFNKDDRENGYCEH